MCELILQNMKQRVEAILIKPNISIRGAMRVIQQETHKAPDTPGNIALAVDKDGKLIGIVTDGDIRRAILGGIDIDDCVDKIINTNPATFHKNTTTEEILEQTIDIVKERKTANSRLDVIITVDDDNKPHDVFPFFELWKRGEIKTRVVSIVGLGYVGLTLGLTLADLGFKVIGVDSNKKVVKQLKNKKSHIHERGIETLLNMHLNKNFFIQDKFENNDSDVYVICVGTPVNEQGRVNTEALKNALQYITNTIKKDDLVVLRSTIPVGSCRDIVVPFIEKKTNMKIGEDFHVGFAPERTIEGDALNELRTLPQVIGGYDKKSTELTVKLFKHLTDSIVLVDNIEDAEMVKLINNTYRDFTFSFANEMALICDKFNLDSHKVINAANYGYARSLVPKPSPGVGGYCLTKDPYILVDSVRKKGYDAKLPLLARNINDKMLDHVCEKVDTFAKKQKLTKSKIKIFAIGLAFKGEPETSDIRGSTSMTIINKLKKKYKNIVVYDPVIKKGEIKKLGLTHNTLNQGFKDADCVLVLNNHKSYKDLDIYKLLSTMNKSGMFFDAWHLFDKTAIEQINNIDYQSI